MCIHTDTCINIYLHNLHTVHIQFDRPVFLQLPIWYDSDGVLPTVRHNQVPELQGPRASV